MGATVAFVFGLIYGSFLNVVILRFDDWLSILKDRSHCTHCKETLNWYDLVPVVSYVTLRGRCRYCQKPISWQYPVVEVATAFLLAGSYILTFENILLPFSGQLISFILLTMMIGSLMVIFFHDLREMMIPDSVSYVFLIASLLFSLIYYRDAMGTLYAGLVGFLPIALLVYPSQGKWMGEGDVKLATGIALMAGYPNAIVAVGSAFILGGLYGLLAVVGKKAKLKSAVPFGPFLIIGGLLALFWGNTVIQWYLVKVGYF